MHTLFMFLCNHSYHVAPSQPTPVASPTFPTGLNAVVPPMAPLTGTIAPLPQPNEPLVGYSENQPQLQAPVSPEGMPPPSPSRPPPPPPPVPPSSRPPPPSPSRPAPPPPSGTIVICMCIIFYVKLFLGKIHFCPQ